MHSGNKQNIRITYRNTAASPKHVEFDGRSNLYDVLSKYKLPDGGAKVKKKKMYEYNSSFVEHW